MTIYHFANKRRSMAVTLVSDDKDKAYETIKEVINPEWVNLFSLEAKEELPENTIHIQEWFCTLEFQHYSSNDTISIDAIDARTGEPVMTLTINIESMWTGFKPYKEVFKFPAVVIDGRDYKAGVPEQLQAQGVITLGAYIAGTNGEVHTAILTEKWQEIAMKQLKPVKNDRAGSKAKRG